MSSKKLLRKKFSLIRKRKYYEVDESFFFPIIKIIKKKKFKNIAIYYSSNYEVSTLKLFKILNNKTRYSTLLPVLAKGSMKFTKWNLYEPLKVNNFGFLDPINSKNYLKPDLIIVPLLAYDKFKNRLGYGKGYYDKTLTKYSSKNPNIITIGLAFSFQKYKKIPISKYDVKLNYIFTQKGLY